MPPAGTGAPCGVYRSGRDSSVDSEHLHDPHDPRLPETARRIEYRRMQPESTRFRRPDRQRRSSQFHAAWCRQRRLAAVIEPDMREHRRTLPEQFHVQRRADPARAIPDPDGNGYLARTPVGLAGVLPAAKKGLLAALLALAPVPPAFGSPTACKVPTNGTPAGMDPRTPLTGAAFIAI